MQGFRRRSTHRTGGDRCVPPRLLREPQDALQFEESEMAAKRRKKIQLLCFLCLFVAQDFCVQCYSLISIEKLRELEAPHEVEFHTRHNDNRNRTRATTGRKDCG